MVFWRRKKNETAQAEEERDEALLHPNGEPGLEPPIESEPEIVNEDAEHELEGTDSDVLNEIDTTPVPHHTKAQDALDDLELADDSNTGGWLSRLTSGLSKSSGKLTQGLSDLITKRKLDQEMIDELEELCKPLLDQTCDQDMAPNTPDAGQP